LVGERGHYELDAGRDARPYLEAMRRMASGGGMLPEQVWDAAPIPEHHLAPGRPSGSAMPLAWAHAEYVKLVRSIALGHSIDRPEAAWRRYRGIAPRTTRATWRFAAPRPSMPAGRTLRLEVMAAARVRYLDDRSCRRPVGDRAALAGLRHHAHPAPGQRRGRVLLATPSRVPGDTIAE
jgi:glucoamylase